MRYIVSITFMIAALAGISPAISQNAPKPGALPCVDVQIGQDHAPPLNCLNDALQQEVSHQQGAPAIQAPIDARSPSNQVGTFNDGAAREQMGNSFGNSAQPQRPKSVFVSPLIPSTPH